MYNKLHFLLGQWIAFQGLTVQFVIHTGDLIHLSAYTKVSQCYILELMQHKKRLGFLDLPSKVQKK